MDNTTAQAWGGRVGGFRRGAPAFRNRELSVSGLVLAGLEYGRNAAALCAVIMAERAREDPLEAMRRVRREVGGRVKGQVRTPGAKGLEYRYLT
jgi:hypothetical protein